MYLLGARAGAAPFVAVGTNWNCVCDYKLCRLYEHPCQESIVPAGRPAAPPALAALLMLSNCQLLARDSATYSGARRATQSHAT